MSGIGGQEADPVDDPDLDAAEYVLGVLRPDQARAVEALALADSAFAAGISAWEVRLGLLADIVSPVAPPRQLWRRLALATGIESVQSRRQRSHTPAGRIWASLRLWRGLAFTATLAAAAFAALLLRPPPAAAPVLLAALSPIGTSGATFLVRVDADGNAVIVAPVPLLTTPGRALELWALAPGAAAPVSLGVLPEAGPARLRAPARPGIQLLVSQEPSGGSPTGQPTGPVVYSGIITAGG